MHTPNIFVIAAGSGGHIIPTLQLSKQWQTKNPQGKIYAFTGTSALEGKILKTHHEISGIYYCKLNKFSRTRWWMFPLIIVQLIVIFFKSLALILYQRPEKLITTGGLLSVPVAYAAWIIRCPIEIYELNVVPGKAITVLLGIATKINIVFPQTKKLCRWGFINFSHKCSLQPYPLRFTHNDTLIRRENIVHTINSTIIKSSGQLYFNVSRKTIFILGGSQGSRLLNNLIKDFLLRHKGSLHNVQIVHQTGSFEENDWNSWYTEQNIPAITFSYNQNIHEFYVLADIIICRAGAGTLFEIAFFKRPCIVIPLVTSTTHHQVQNAHAMAQEYPHLFHVIDQATVTQNPELVDDTIQSILFN